MVGTHTASTAETERRRLSAILRRLRAEYGEVKGFLSAASPFELLIAVILSAQTTDRQVNRITPALFDRFPDAASLAAAPISELEGLLHAVGFFRVKARNIKAAARALCDRFGGKVPESMDDLVSIPGVGRKSANVIRGACFGFPAVIVDTHFSRVSVRLRLAPAGPPEKIEAHVRATVPARNQMELSMLLNKHGREYCHARKPDCERCPIAQWCPIGSPGLFPAAPAE